MFESSRWVTQLFQAFLDYAKTITWTETWSECSICHSRGLSSFKNTVWLPAVLVNRIPPGTSELPAALTWHWWTNYQTTRKLRSILILLVHRCWQHSSVVSLREFQKKSDNESSIVLSAIDGICFCVNQPLSFRQRKLLKAKHPSCTSNYHPYLLQRCTAAIAGTHERQRQERTEKGTLWYAHILPSCISKSCPISITVDFVLSYEWFLRFIQIWRCRRLLEISGGCVCHPTALQTQYRL